jgi:hypothetical protein
MKAGFFLFIMIPGIIISCDQQKKSPIEGAWQMVYAQDRSMDETFPVQIQGGQIKIWTEGYFAFVGHFELDTLIIESYGGGPYKFEGNRCEAIRQYHSSKSLAGTTARWLIEIRNDTLIQKWPADENWNLPEKYSTEIYIRLK